MRHLRHQSRLELTEKFWANNFTLLDGEGNTSGPLNKGGIADLTLLKTLLEIQQKHSETITSLAELHLKCSRLFFWYGLKKWFLGAIAAAQATENHGDEWDLTWYLWWGYIHQFQPGHTNFSSRSTAEAPRLKIFCHGTNDHEHHPQSTGE